MSSTTRSIPNPLVPAAEASRRLPSDAPAAGRAVASLLQRLAHGTLDVQWPDGSVGHFGSGQAGEPRAAIRLLDWQVCAAVLKSGDIGFAQSHFEGHWSSPDVVALIKLFIANRDALDAAVYGTWWGSALHRLRHLLHRNTRAGSRRNIHAHYDLGNRFYRLWLDDTLSYSAACFGADRGQPLESAQRAKIGRALRQVRLAPGQRLLEIGCGWGALAEQAAREHGASVTGLTLSTEQLAAGQERIAAAGLQAQVQLRLQDYRDLREKPFDAIVSIEMFEAVGRDYWDAYFQTLRRQLKPGGLACIQSITIRDELFHRYLRGTDFIQQYVFPGGLLPSREAFRAQAARFGFTLQDEFAFGADYAETLRRWRTAFQRREAEVRAQGFDERFMRLWDFYLAYCEAAFDSGSTDVVQFTLRRGA
jgi:cyclopropane-fatty-acyl-phospholipid synthase